MTAARHSEALLCRNCPRCETDNSGERVLAYSWREWRLRRCRDCRFVYLENPPDYSQLSVTHAWEKNYQDHDVRMQREYPVTRSLSRRWGRIRRWLVRKPDKMAKRVGTWVPPGRVIDVGCGSAERLRALPRQYETIGIEISKALACEAEAGLAGRNGSVVNLPAIQGLAAMEAASATGVLMRSFLEHEHSPAALLMQVARVLKSGGVTIVKVPNYASVNRRIMGARWCGFRFPGHVNYFTPASLKEMVEAAGLTTVSFGSFDRFPLSDNMWMVARKDREQ